MRKEYYFYVLDAVLSAGGVGSPDLTDYIRIGADADFVVKKVSISATNDKAKIFIKDTSTATDWQSSALEIKNFAGNYGLNSRPNTLFVEKRVKGNNTLTIVLNNPDAVENVIQIVLEGYKDYK